MTKTKEEVKQLLKDWLISSTILLKAGQPKCDSMDIAIWWRQVLGIRITEKWVDKCLYHKSKGESKL